VETNPLRFLPYLSLSKSWNVLKVLVSYSISLVLKRPMVWGRPFFLHIESTNLCNLRCIECPVGMGISTRPTGNLTFNQFKKYFDPIKKNIIYLVLYFQGEPFLNPELLNMIRYSQENRVYTMLSTNGHLLNNEDKV